MNITFGERCFMLALIFILFALIIGVTETHANTYEEGGYCGEAPTEAVQISCLSGWDATSLSTGYAVAETTNEICWCHCDKGIPLCSCEYPADTNNNEWIWYLVYQGQPNQTDI